MRKTDDDTIIQMLKEGKLQKDIAAHFGVSPAAISKRVKRLVPEPESLDRLSTKEKRFAFEVAGGKNQTQAAMVSHDCTSLSSAKSMGYQLMQKHDIQTAVAEIMQQQGLTRTYRVRMLKKHVDHKDPNVSLKALDQSWKLEGAYTENHRHLVVTWEDCQEGDEQIKKIDREIAILEGQTSSDGTVSVDDEIAILEKELSGALEGN